MTTLRNKSFYGDIDVPALGGVVNFGDEIIVDESVVYHSQMVDGELVTTLLVDVLVDGGHFEVVGDDEAEKQDASDDDDQSVKPDAGGDAAEAIADPPPSVPPADSPSDDHTASAPEGAPAASVQGDAA